MKTRIKFCRSFQQQILGEIFSNVRQLNVVIYVDATKESKASTII